MTCLYPICTSGHCKFSSLNRSSSVKFHGDHERWAFFKSSQKFSTGLKSGLCLGHSRTLTSLFWKHSCTALALRLRSLSSPNTNALPHVSSGFPPGYPCVDFPSLILRSPPGPAAEKRPDSVMSACLKVEMHRVWLRPDVEFSRMAKKLNFGLIRPQIILPAGVTVSHMANLSQYVRRYKDVNSETPECSLSNPWHL